MPTDTEPESETIWTKRSVRIAILLLIVLGSLLAGFYFVIWMGEPVTHHDQMAVNVNFDVANQKVNAIFVSDFDDADVAIDYVNVKFYGKNASGWNGHAEARLYQIGDKVTLSRNNFSAHRHAKIIRTPTEFPQAGERIFVEVHRVNSTVQLTKDRSF